MAAASLPRLIYMANQIGKFFVTEDKNTAVANIADHLHKFWDPRMRAEIAAHLANGGEGIDPPVREAIASLSASSK
jgi:formate dehydrogenase subunit delta